MNIKPHRNRNKQPHKPSKTSFDDILIDTAYLGPENANSALC